MNVMFLTIIVFYNSKLSLSNVVCGYFQQLSLLCYFDWIDSQLVIYWLMGNQTGNAFRNEVEIKLRHANLSSSKLVNISGQVMLKTSVCMDQKEYQKWRSLVQTYAFQSKLFLPLTQHFSKTSLCGTAGTVNIYYPNYAYLLYDQLLSRNPTKHQFSQQDMWYLLFSLIKAKTQANKTVEMLGDVRPKNIMLNQIGDIKVPTLNTWPLQLNKYQKALANIPTYLAPQQIKFLEEGIVQTFNLTEAAEMFSIGLTMLSASNLQDYEWLYNLQKNKFDFFGFDQAISQLIKNNQFSQVLRSTIMNLCSIEVKRRMTLTQVYNLMSKHGEAICARQNFIIDNAPPKLHDQVNLLRTILTQKAASYPSYLPERTDKGCPSFISIEEAERLVPSHLNENTLSALQND